MRGSVKGMCTALTLKTNDGNHLFGRNLDFEEYFNQAILLVPRQFSYVNNLTNRTEKTDYAIIGMGTLIDGHPSLADGLNEKGLACAVLDLPQYTYWSKEMAEGKINISPSDVILWILSNYESLEELKTALINLNIIGKSIIEGQPPGDIHWMITDKSGKSIVIEKTKSKLKIYENKIGVLTNSPTFDWHLTNLNRYLKTEPSQPNQVKWGEQLLKPFSQGFGAIGIPGDFSSPSRFIKAAFLRNNAVIPQDTDSALIEMFHILNSVAMVRGAVRTDENKDDITQYSSCMCQEQGIYYYTTYNNTQITAIKLFEEDLNRDSIKSFPYRDQVMIHYENSH